MPLHIQQQHLSTLLTQRIEISSSVVFIVVQHQFYKSWIRIQREEFQKFMTCKEKGKHNAIAIHQRLISSSCNSKTMNLSITSNQYSHTFEKHDPQKLLTAYLIKLKQTRLVTWQHKLPNITLHIHSLARSFALSLTYSLTHSLTHSLTRSLTHSFPHSLAQFHLYNHNLPVLFRQNPLHYSSSLCIVHGRNYFCPKVPWECRAEC